MKEMCRQSNSFPIIYEVQISKIPDKISSSVFVSLSYFTANIPLPQQLVLRYSCFYPWL